MALTFSTPASELRDALALTAERETETGRLWCPPRVSKAIRTAIIDRTEALGDLIWQVVPFARLAALCSKHGYVEFIYGMVQSLRSEAFRASLTNLKSSGSFERGLVVIEATGVAILDVKPSAGTRYEISYAQMPKLAAFLDVLHNSIGFAEVDTLLGPMTRRATPPPIGEIARPLRNRFNEWLAPRLESNHRRSQAKILHAFLAARSALVADKIDDATVLDFWQDRAAHWHRRCKEVPAAIDQAQKEGFRTFESVVDAILAYRDALDDVLTEHRLANGFEVNSTASSFLEQLSAQEETTNNVWINPIAALSRSPANAIKWLTQKEMQQLAHFLGKSGAGDEAADSRVEPTESGLRSTGDTLERDRPFSIALARTLLRLDVFAPVQTAVTKSRDKRSPEERLARALSLVPSSYEAAVTVYSDVAGQLRVELLAALHILALAADPIAFLIVDHLGGPDAARTIAGAPVENEARRLHEVAQRLASVFSGEAVVSDAVQALADAARGARNRVARQGFEQSNSGADRLEGLRTSVPHAIILHQLLDRLSVQLSTAVAGYDIDSDRAQFTDTFMKLYAGSAVAS